MEAEEDGHPFVRSTQHHGTKGGERGGEDVGSAGGAAGVQSAARGRLCAVCRGAAAAPCPCQVPGARRDSPRPAAAAWHSCAAARASWWLTAAVHNTTHPPPPCAADHRQPRASDMLAPP